MLAREHGYRRKVRGQNAREQARGASESCNLQVAMHDAVRVAIGDWLQDLLDAMTENYRTQKKAQEKRFIIIENVVNFVIQALGYSTLNAQLCSNSRTYRHFHMRRSCPRKQQRKAKWQELVFGRQSCSWSWFLFQIIPNYSMLHFN